MTKTTKNSIVFFAIIGVIFIFYTSFKAVLLPFIVGAMIAYLMSSTLDRIRPFLGTSLGATLLILIVLIAIFGIFFSLFPLFQSEIKLLLSKAPTYAKALSDQFKRFTENFSQSPYQEDIELALKKYSGDILKWGLEFLLSLFSSGLALANLISLLVITPVVAFYLLKDWEAFTQGAKNLLPKTFQVHATELFQNIDLIIRAFIKGQTLVCLTLSVFYALSLKILGLDFAIVVGTLSGIIAFIPYVGALSGILISLLIGISQFGVSSHLFFIIAIFVTGIILEGYVLSPILIGDRVGLHPLWIIFAILAGGSLLGFAGVLLAVPLAATIGVLIRFSLKHYKKSRLYLSK